MTINFYYFYLNWKYLQIIKQKIVLEKQNKENSVKQKVNTLFLIVWKLSGKQS